MMNTIIKELEAKGYVANTVEVVKNGVTMKGITVGKEGQNVMPTIYENESWKEKSLNDIVREIENIVANNVPEIDTDKLMDPDFIRSHVRLCIQKKGTEDIIKEDYLDLEVYPRVYISDEASFKLQKGKFEDVIDAAFNNTKGTFKIKGMLETMAETMGISLSEIKGQMGIPEDMVDEQYVVTNTNGTQGASCLYFTGLFKEFCRDLHIDGCYVLPSSIHEVIVIPDTDGTKGDMEGLDEMVTEVNATRVAPEEQLADHCYYYDLATNEFSY